MLSLNSVFYSNSEEIITCEFSWILYHSHTTVTWHHLFMEASLDHSVPVWCALTSAMDSQFYNTSYKCCNYTLHAVPNHICPSSLLSVKKIKPKMNFFISFWWFRLCSYKTQVGLWLHVFINIFIHNHTYISLCLL